MQDRNCFYNGAIPGTSASEMYYNNQATFSQPQNGYYLASQNGFSQPSAVNHSWRQQLPQFQAPTQKTPFRQSLNQPSSLVRRSVPTRQNSIDIPRFSSAPSASNFTQQPMVEAASNGNPCSSSSSMSLSTFASSSNSFYGYHHPNQSAQTNNLMQASSPHKQQHVFHNNPGFGITTPSTNTTNSTPSTSASCGTNAPKSNQHQSNSVQGTSLAQAFNGISGNTTHHHLQQGSSGSFAFSTTNSTNNHQRQHQNLSGHHQLLHQQRVDSNGAFASSVATLTQHSTSMSTLNSHASSTMSQLNQNNGNGVANLYTNGGGPSIAAPVSSRERVRRTFSSCSSTSSAAAHGPPPSSANSMTANVNFNNLNIGTNGNNSNIMNNTLNSSFSQHNNHNVGSNLNDINANKTRSNATQVLLHHSSNEFYSDSKNNKMTVNSVAQVGVSTRRGRSLAMLAVNPSSSVTPQLQQQVPGVVDINSFYPNDTTSFNTQQQQQQQQLSYNNNNNISDLHLSNKNIHNNNFSNCNTTNINISNNLTGATTTHHHHHHHHHNHNHNSHQSSSSATPLQSNVSIEEEDEELGCLCHLNGDHKSIIQPVIASSIKLPSRGPILAFICAAAQGLSDTSHFSPRSSQVSSPSKRSPLMGGAVSPAGSMMMATGGAMTTLSMQSSNSMMDGKRNHEPMRLMKDAVQGLEHQQLQQSIIIQQQSPDSQHRHQGMILCDEIKNVVNITNNNTNKPKYTLILDTKNNNGATTVNGNNQNLIHCHHSEKKDALVTPPTCSTAATTCWETDRIAYPSKLVSSIETSQHDTAPPSSNNTSSNSLAKFLMSTCVGSNCSPQSSFTDGAVSSAANTPAAESDDTSNCNGNLLKTDINVTTPSSERRRKRKVLLSTLPSDAELTPKQDIHHHHSLSFDVEATDDFNSEHEDTFPVLAAADQAASAVLSQAISSSSAGVVAVKRKEVGSVSVEDDEDFVSSPLVKFDFGNEDDPKNVSADCSLTTNKPMNANCAIFSASSASTASTTPASKALSYNHVSNNNNNSCIETELHLQMQKHIFPQQYQNKGRISTRTRRAAALAAMQVGGANFPLQHAEDV